jgi:hypothetical protein
MTLRQPPNTPIPPPHEGTDFEDALRAAAALDGPPKHLQERILKELERKKRLDALVVQNATSHSWLWPTATALSFASAAAIGLFFWRSVALPARPELPRGSTNAAASTTPSLVVSSQAATGVPSATAKTPPPDPCLKGTRATGNSPLIDDFEDGDDFVLASEQRSGFWRWSRDTDKPGTAPALIPTEHPSPTKNNRNAVHVKGAVLRDWGASIEMKFDSSCYDASAYAGVTFSARGPGRIYISPREVGVIPPDFGGTCEHDCYNGHALKIDLGKNFQTYEVRWSDVTQRGYGRPPLDPKRLHDITFLIHPEDTPYDIWLDDVRFLTK